MLPLIARQILAELELVACGTCQSWNSDGHSAERPALPPSGLERRGQWTETPIHLHYRRLMLENPHKLDQLIEQAREEHNRLTGRYVRPEPKGELVHERNQRIIREGAGHTIDQVVRAFAYCNLTAREVRQIRQAARDPERDIALGNPLKPAEDPVDRVLRLAAGNASLSEIAKTVPFSRAKVHRIIQERAA